MMQRYITQCNVTVHCVAWHSIPFHPVSPPHSQVTPAARAVEVVLAEAPHAVFERRGADLILMMEQGSLVEQGTHDQLLESQGRYYALYSQQEANFD